MKEVSRPVVYKLRSLGRLWFLNIYKATVCATDFVVENGHCQVEVM